MFLPRGWEGCALRGPLGPAGLTQLHSSFELLWSFLAAREARGTYAH
jgi:hypothetical protein